MWTGRKFCWPDVARSNVRQDCILDCLMQLLTSVEAARRILPMSNLNSEVVAASDNPNFVMSLG